MKVVIDIPENDYKLACNYPDALIACYAHYIKAGVPLPKKYGRLVDVDELIEDLKHDVAIDQDILDYGELTEISRRLIQDDKDIKQNTIDLLEHTRGIIEAEGAEE